MSANHHRPGFNPGDNRIYVENITVHSLCMRVSFRCEPDESDDADLVDAGASLCLK